GGYWYYYGNTGRFLSRQGLYGTFGHTMGRVLKLSYHSEPPDPDSEQVPKFPWYVFNNSWHLRCPLIGGASAAVPVPPEKGEGPGLRGNVDFFKKALGWCDAAQYGPWVCEPIELIHHFDFGRSAATRFDYDICDRADYLRDMQARGQEANGIVAAGPL